MISTKVCRHTCCYSNQRDRPLPDEIPSDGVAVPHREPDKGELGIPNMESQLVVPHRVEPCRLRWRVSQVVIIYSLMTAFDPNNDLNLTIVFDHWALLFAAIDSNTNYLHFNKGVYDLIKCLKAKYHFQQMKWNKCYCVIIATVVSLSVTFRQK